MYKLIAFALLLLLAGCSQNYIPVAGTGTAVSADYLVAEDTEGVIALTPAFWVYDPENLSDYYTVFELKYRNRSKQKITVNIKDIVLLDQYDSQYGAISTQEVLNLLLSDEPFAEAYMLSAEEREEFYAKRIEGRKNILQRSFVYGEIYPGAVKEGYIFFNKLNSSNQKVQIIIKGKKFVFKKPKK